MSATCRPVTATLPFFAAEMAAGAVLTGASLPPVRVRVVVPLLTEPPGASTPSLTVQVMVRVVLRP
jgi:hypothetical protein